MYNLYSLFSIVFFLMSRKLYSISFLLVSTFLLTSCSTVVPGAASNWAQGVQNGNIQPKTQADIQWTVKSVTGNQFTIETTDMSSDPIFQEMQSEDFRTKMQSMTDAERQALMEKMQTARTNAKKIIVEVTIPVGIPIILHAGRASNFGGGGMTMGWWSRWSSSGRPNTNAGIGTSLGTGQKKPADSPTSLQKEWTIADIKVGSTVSIWTNPDVPDRRIASWATVSTAVPWGSGANSFWGGNGYNQRPSWGARPL